MLPSPNCSTNSAAGRTAGTPARPPSAPASPLPIRRQTDLSNLDVLFPASTVNGNQVTAQRTTEGVGVPLVGWKKTSPVGQKRDKFLLPNGLPYNLTATLAFDECGPACLALRQALETG